MKDIEDLDLKGAIPFISKIAKQGKDTRIITVPKRLWENKIVDENEIYIVYLVPTGKRKKTKK